MNNKLETKIEIDCQVENEITNSIDCNSFKILKENLTTESLNYFLRSLIQEKCKKCVSSKKSIIHSIDCDNIAKYDFGFNYDDIYIIVANPPWEEIGNSELTKKTISVANFFKIPLIKNMKGILGLFVRTRDIDIIIQEASKNNHLFFKDCIHSVILNQDPNIMPTYETLLLFRTSKIKKLLKYFKKQHHIDLIFQMETSKTISQEYFEYFEDIFSHIEIKKKFVYLWAEDNFQRKKWLSVHEK